MNMKNRHTNFWEKNKIKMTFECLGNTPAPWDPSGLCYQVTMKKYTPSNKQCTFKFWDSRRNMDLGEKPTAYDVLACISGDVTYDDPEELISEGLADNMTSARKIARFAKRLQKFFTPAEQAELSEIQ